MGKERSLLIANIDVLNGSQFILKKDIEDKNKEDEVQIVYPIAKNKYWIYYTSYVTSESKRLRNCWFKKSESKVGWCNQEEGIREENIVEHK